MALPPLLAVTGTSLGTQVSIGHVLLQMVVAMAVVIGGIWGFAKIMGRTGRGGSRPRVARPPARGRRPTPGLTVLSRQAVGKGKSIAVVRAGARCFLVGISDAGLNPLGELDPPEGDHRPPASRVPASRVTTARPSTAHPSTVTVRSLPAASAAPSLDGGSWLDSLRQATVRR